MKNKRYFTLIFVVGLVLIAICDIVSQVVLSAWKNQSTVSKTYAVGWDEITEVYLNPENEKNKAA